MTLKQFTFEGGSEGTTLTTANSGADLVQATGGSAVFAAATAAHGGFGGKFTNAANAQAVARFSPAAANNIMAWSGVCTLPSGTNSGNLNLASARYSGGPAARLYMLPNGDIYWADSANNAISNGTTTILIPNAVSSQYFGLKVRFIYLLNVTTGACTFKAYAQSNQTQIGNTISATGQSLGTNPITAGDYGIVSSNNGATTVGWDDIQYNDGSTTEIGDLTPAANAKPTASYSAATANVAAGASVSNQLTGVDSDGSITAYQHSVFYSSAGTITLNNATSATCTFTAPAAGNLVILQGTVTDNGGAVSDPVYREIRVPTSTGTVTPLPIASTGGFARVGSATTDGAALADSDDTTYMESATLTTSAQTLRIRVQPAVTRTGTLAVVIRLRMTGTSATAAIRLMEGTTSRGSLGSIAVTSSWADYELDLNSTQAGNITDWGNVFAEIDGTT